MIRIPPGAKTIEWPTSTAWFNEEGILYSISKKAPPLSLEESKKIMNELLQLIGDKKVCFLADVTHAGESPREIRDYAAQEFPKFIKAVAMVSDSAIGKMLANLFFTV